MYFDGGSWEYVGALSELMQQLFQTIQFAFQHVSLQNQRHWLGNTGLQSQSPQLTWEAAKGKEGG